MKLLALIFLAFATSTYASFDLKTEFDHLKNIAKSLINNGNPQQIIKDAIQQHPQIQDRVAKICKISLVQEIDFVKKACDYLTSTAAPVQKRDISSIVANVQDKFSQFTAGLSADLEKFKTVAAQIVAKIDVKSIIKTIVNLDLPDKITQVCAVPGLQTIQQVKQVCDFATPIADQLKPYQKQAEQAIQNLRKRSVLDSIKGKLDAIKGKVKDEFNQLKDAAHNLFHNHAAAPAPVADAPAPVDDAPAVDAPAPVQKRDISAVFGTISSKVQAGLEAALGAFKTELANLKEIANRVTKGQDPVTFIKQLIQTGSTKALATVCGIPFAQQIPYVKSGCQALQNVGVAPAPAPVDDASVPVDDAPAPVQKRDIGAVFNTIKGKLETIKDKVEDKFNHLKDTVNNLLHNNAAAPAPAPVDAAPAPVDDAPVQKRDIGAVFNTIKGKLDTIKGKVQDEFNQLKDAAHNLFHNHAAAPAPVDDAPAPVDPAPADDAHPVEKRGFNFGSILQNVQNVANNVLTGPLAQYKDKIDAFTKLAALVTQKPTPSPVQIIQAVVDLGLQKDVANLCSASFLQSVQPVQDSCKIVVPLLNSASTLAQLAPGLLQSLQG